MLKQVGTLYQSSDLIWAWTGRTIRGRYQQSVLGWLWAVVQPIVTVAIFTLIFTRFVPVDTSDVPYILFSYVAVTPWTFLATSLADMSNSLVMNMDLVTKIYFPREALPIAAMLARLLDFAIAVVLLFAMIFYYQTPLTAASLLYLPAILAIQVLLLIGLGFALAALNVFFRDVQPLLTLGLQLWFYLSPIIYPVSLVPEHLRTLYSLNPMVGILEAYRSVLLHGEPPNIYLAISAVISIVFFFGGYWFFKRVEFQFADIV